MSDFLTKAATELNQSTVWDGSPTCPTGLTIAIANSVQKTSLSDVFKEQIL